MKKFSLESIHPDIVKVAAFGIVFSLLIAGLWAINVVQALMINLMGTATLWRVFALIATLVLYAAWFYALIVITGAATATILPTATIVEWRNERGHRWLKPMRAYVDWLIKVRQEP